MAEPLVKVILDTSIYIPFINEGVAHPVLELEYETPLLYMSVVVIEELYAGALDNSSVKLLDRLHKTFDNLDRLVVPEASDWQKTGKIIAKLSQKYGLEKNFLSRMTNDILITLSARQIGAVVVTNNIRDFLRIKEFVDFEIYGEI
jgi:predicted nucleic acid-binding protein